MEKKVSFFCFLILRLPHSFPYQVWRSRRSKAKSALGGLAEMQERREKAVAEDAGYEGDDGEEWRQADELVKALKKRRGPPPRGGAGAQPAARG